MKKADKHWGEMSRVSDAIGSTRFMDPPDGGSPTLAEQVARMRQALEAAEARIAELEAMPGLKRIEPMDTTISDETKAALAAVDKAMQQRTDFIVGSRPEELDEVEENIKTLLDARTAELEERLRNADSIGEWRDQNADDCIAELEAALARMREALEQALVVALRAAMADGEDR